MTEGKLEAKRKYHREYMKVWHRTEKGKASSRKYNCSPKGKATNKRCRKRHQKEYAKSRCVYMKKTVKKSHVYIGMIECPRCLRRGGLHKRLIKNVNSGSISYELMVNHNLPLGKHSTCYIPKKGFPEFYRKYGDFYV